MYFTPSGYINSKKKHLFKNYLYNQKKLLPFDFQSYPLSIISKQYGFLTGRRIEAFRKGLVKFISLKTTHAGQFHTFENHTFFTDFFLNKIPFKKLWFLIKINNLNADLLFSQKQLFFPIKKNLRITFKRNCNLTNPLTKKGTLTRMGKGKGKLTGWISFIRPGISLFHYPSIDLTKKTFNPNNCLLQSPQFKFTYSSHSKKHKFKIPFTWHSKQKAYYGPFKHRLPFKCKIYGINLYLNFNQKQHLLW